MNVVELRPERDADNIATALRNIADDIEAGMYRFDPTLAVVVLASEHTTRGREDVVIGFDWQTHGLGKGADSQFAARGVLASALNKWDGPGGNE